jgi:hypothetical protein
MALESVSAVFALTLRPFRDRFAFSLLKSSRRQIAFDFHSLRIRFAIALIVLSNALRSLCDRFAIDLRPLYNLFASIASHYNRTHFAIT